MKISNVKLIQVSESFDRKGSFFWVIEMNKKYALCVMRRSDAKNALEAINHFYVKPKLIAKGGGDVHYFIVKDNQRK